MAESVIKKPERHGWTAVSKSYTTPSANAWVNTGLSVTVPDGHIYVARARQGWNSGRPIGIGFNRGTLGSGQSPDYTLYNPDSGLTAYMLAAVLDTGTWDLYTYRGSTGTNTYWIYWLDVTV